MLDFSAETRAKYHKQHVRVANSDDAMDRFIGMFPEKYFGLAPGFFKGARVCDAGCGSTGKLLIALHRLGAGEIHGFDLGTDFKTTTTASLERYGVPRARVTLKSGSVLDIPYPDRAFDFTACHGVLVHLNNQAEAERAMRELARITKPGGQLYTVFGCVGGFFEDCLFPAVRKYYRENADFKRFIDRIEPANFAELIDLVEKGLAENEGERLSLGFLKPLLDVDFAVLFQNVIQTPVRLQISEATIRQWYADNGFGEVRRLSRYVKRKNIRKFTAQLHGVRGNPLVDMLYGSGNLEFIAERQ